MNAVAPVIQPLETRNTSHVMNSQINPIRTLVVDDSADEWALLNAELRFVNSIKLIGFVHNGVEAIHYLRGLDSFGDRNHFPYPDLLFLDFCMPLCGGMGVLKYLQRQFVRPHVVLWSNTLDRVNIPLALHLGADLVCRKPVDGRELMKIVNHVETSIFNTQPVFYSPESPETARAQK